MKRFILHITWMLLLLAAFPACTSENLYFTTDNNGKSIKLYLNTRGNEIARAVADPEAGEDNYGENTIEIVDVFFYQTDNKSYLHHRFNVKVSQTADNEGYYTANVPLPDNSQINLAGSTVYVVGNGTVDITEEQAKASTSETISNLLMKFQTPTLKNIPSTDSRFIMDGQSTVTGTGTDMNAKIDLARAAAKISLTVNIPKELVIKKENSEETITYVPSTDLEQEKKISAIFYNGIETYNLTDIVKFDTESRVPGLTEDGENSKYIAQFSPFYSYPTSWNISAADEPYIMLTIPWKVKEGSATSFKEYYYRVPVNKTNFDEESTTSLSLKRNHWYKITLDVNVLGTPEPNTLLPATSKYEIAPWGNFPIGTNLLDYKYLVVDKHEVSIYNQPSASIAFKSSDDVIITINKIEYKNYAQVNTRTIRLSKNSSGESLKQQSTDEKNWTNYVSGNNENDLNTYTDYKIKDDNEENTLTHTEVELKKDAGNIVFYHEILENTLTPHDIYITVQHRDNSSYSEQIKITQYPPIYIKGATSNGNVFVNEKTDNDGSIYTDTGNHFLGSIISRSSIGSGGTSQNSNTNPNQYTMYVTVIEDYNIGDPRVALGTEWKYANQFDEDKNMIYYRPTRTDAANVMAPIFKIASSYARTNSITFENAQKRCASYQENGYPAGRWRIPTAAEMEFITSLWGVGAIPSIFNSAYWVADGRQYDYAGGNGFTNSTSSTTVRCVYDVWYWGDTQQSNALRAPQWAVETID